MDLALFHSDRSWLEDQPGMTPWSDGCHKLCDQLVNLTDAYHRRLLEREPSEEAQSAYWHRFWRCWRFHWREASDSKDGPVDGFQGLRNLRARKGFLGRGKYKEDLLEDVCLAEAVCQKDEPARLIFRARFHAVVMSTARKILVNFDEEDQWLGFMNEHLAPPLGRALPTYQGHGALKTWVRITAHNYFLDKSGQRQPLGTPARPRPLPKNQIAGPRQPTNQIVMADMLEFCLSKLSDNERLSAQMHSERYSNAEIAQALGLSKGQASRLKNRALEKLRECINRQNRI